MNTHGKLLVGGQAVMEGVMMRTPHRLAVAVRRANGEIVLRDTPWRSLWDRFRFLRWPFLRGVLVLLETLFNGISTLNFSAKIAMADEAQNAESKKNRNQTETSGIGDAKPGQEKPHEVSDLAIWSTVLFALALGMGLFVALPHLAVWFGSLLVGRELQVTDVVFHIIVGGVKFCVFLGYISLISLMKDVKRFFMYHGAEHQSIAAYEAGQELTVTNAGRHSPLHPRCGTTFLILVIAVSIFLFSLVFPLLIRIVGEPTGQGWLNQIIYVGIKLPLLLPIAGLAYELQRLTSRHMENPLAKILAWPGLAIQRMTTRPPTEDQLEVALTSLRMALSQEQSYSSQSEERKGEQTLVFADYDAVMKEIPLKT